MATVDSIKQAQALLNVLANQQVFLDELNTVKKQIDIDGTTNVAISVTVRNALNSFGFDSREPYRYQNLLNTLIDNTYAEYYNNINKINELLNKGKG